MNTQNISGGYYMKARKIQESAIMHAPPHVREVWDLFLCRACHSANKYLQRGQLRTTYNEIREALHWMVGWRKMRYSKWDCEGALKWLKKASMITTMKTTKGIIVTICNYSLYQNPVNYESHNENLPKATRTPQTTDTIYKKVKKERKKEKEEEASDNSVFFDFWNSKEKLPAIRIFTKQRKDKLKARMTETLFFENWREIIERLISSDFCTGKNDRGWRADIDWLLKNDTNYTKVVEGKYDNNKATITFDKESAKQRVVMLESNG